MLKMPKVPVKKLTLTVPDVHSVWQSSHWFLKLLFVVGALVGAYYFGRYAERNWYDMNVNVIRQLKGDLTEREIELLNAKKEFNQLQSTIKPQKDLQNEMNALISTNKELKDLQKKNNLKIDSLTVLVGELKNSTDLGEGIPGVDQVTKARTYTWSDEYNRFHLFVPDVTKSYAKFDNDEDFA